MDLDPKFKFTRQNNAMAHNESPISSHEQTKAFAKATNISEGTQITSSELSTE